MKNLPDSGPFYHQIVKRRAPDETSVDVIGRMRNSIVVTDIPTLSSELAWTAEYLLRILRTLDQFDIGPFDLQRVDDVWKALDDFRTKRGE